MLSLSKLRFRACGLGLLSLAIVGCAQPDAERPMGPADAAMPATRDALSVSAPSPNAHWAGELPRQVLIDHPRLGSLELRAERGMILRQRSGQQSAGPADGAREIGLRIAALGRQEMFDLEPVAPVLSGTRVTYPRPGSEEWYEVVPGGLEQGLTLNSRPEGEGPLSVFIALSGMLAEVQGDHALLRSSAPGGREIGRYDSLIVIDADGTEIPATMVGGGARIELRIDDVDAIYPIVIDPLLWDSSLLNLDVLADCGGGGGGTSLDLRNETLVVGASSACVGGETQGAVLVFDRAGSGWAQRALIPSGQVDSLFGATLALTDDALLIAAPGAEVVERFSRFGPRYVHDSTLALRSDAPRSSVGATGFGQAVVGDAQTVVIGAPGLAPQDQQSAGAVFVYRLQAGVWAPQQTLTAETPTTDGSFGALLAIDDNNLIVASASSVRIFERPSPEVRFSPLQTLDAASVGDVSLASGRLLIGRDTGEVRVYEKAADGLFALADTLTLDGPGAARLAADGPRFVASATGIRSYLRVADAFEPEGPVEGAPSNIRGLRLLGTEVLLLDDSGALQIFRSVATLGSSCAGSAECQSGFCVDGVCCESSCGGDAHDCQACSITAGSSADGVCEAAALDTVCRSGVGDCDQPETCDGLSVECPGDLLAQNGTSCRENVGPCDVQDRCTGLSPFCPRDRVEPVGTLCRATSGTCDVEETCDGIRAICPADRFVAEGTTCRPKAGVCDVEESCDGAQARCPADGRQPFGFICRDQSGACDAPEACDGADPSCPSDVWAEDGASCHDGDRCTQGDECLAGRCQSGPMMCEAGPDITDPPPETPSGCTVSMGARRPTQSRAIYLLGLFGLMMIRRRSAR